MFGKKKRIIETQAALIADLNEDLKRAEKVIELQNKKMLKMIETIGILKAHIEATDIDFPNSEKGGADHTGAVNVSDILNL